jgi:L-alanine-DL-glutamate epimerase-like enolase superfamily enzyme
VPLVSLLPAVHDRVPVYGSGGFCSYSDERLREQLGGWVAGGSVETFGVETKPPARRTAPRKLERDPQRLDAAREAIGDAELYVGSRSSARRRSTECV